MNTFLRTFILIQTILFIYQFYLKARLSDGQKVCPFISRMESQLMQMDMSILLGHLEDLQLSEQFH
jgi:hypothetical protein